MFMEVDGSFNCSFADHIHWHNLVVGMGTGVDLRHKTHDLRVRSNSDFYRDRVCIHKSKEDVLFLKEK